MKFIRYKIIIFFIVLIIPIFCSCSNNDSASKTVPYIQSKMLLCIKDNSLCLVEDNEIIRVYDVNISVLPAEDIALLSKGIEVTDESEADTIAENFDG